MTSEDAYAVKRGTFTDWAHQQLKNGRFYTELREEYREEETTGKRVLRNVPVIVYGSDDAKARLGLPLLQVLSQVQNHATHVGVLRL